VTFFEEKTMVAPTMFPKEKGIKLIWGTTSFRDKRIKLPQGAISLRSKFPNV
jgi:hypothetical protein